MEEGRCAFLLFRGQGHPALDAMHPAALSPRFLEAFGMGDALARCHPVHLSRPDCLFAVEAVAMHDLALEQISDRGKADMRMRADVDVARQALGQDRKSTRLNSSH